MKYFTAVLLLLLMPLNVQAQEENTGHRERLYQYAHSQAVNDNEECYLLTKKDNFNRIYYGGFDIWKDITLLVYTIGCGGGNYSAGILDIVKVNGDDIQRLSYYKTSAGLWDVSLDGGALTASTYEYKNGDARCCPSITKRVSYTNNDGKLVPTDLHIIIDEK